MSVYLKYISMKLLALLVGFYCMGLSRGCMVRKIDGTSIYYCDAVTYPCSYGTCVTIPLDHGLVQCQCKASLKS